MQSKSHPGVTKKVGDTVEFYSLARRKHTGTILELLSHGYRIEREDGKVQSLRLDYDNMPPEE